MNKYRQLEMQEKTRSKKEEYKYFVGTTLKNPLEYEIGEKMVFKIRVKYMDDYLDIPFISYTLISDDGQNENGYIEKNADGWFISKLQYKKAASFIFKQRHVTKTKI